MSNKVGGTERTFSTGAKRDTDDGKLQFGRCLSPYALTAVVDYMRRHNSQVHRREDNWKVGIPLESFMDSMWRHFHHTWQLHTELPAGASRCELIDALCGIFFNVHGYLHELTKPEPRQMLDERLNSDK
jgi:hypothetical protein